MQDIISDKREYLTERLFEQIKRYLKTEHGHKNGFFGMQIPIILACLRKSNMMKKDQTKLKYLREAERLMELQKDA